MERSFSLEMFRKKGNTCTLGCIPHFIQLTSTMLPDEIRDLFMGKFYCSIWRKIPTDCSIQMAVVLCLKCRKIEKKNLKRYAQNECTECLCN